MTDADTEEKSHGGSNVPGAEPVLHSRRGLYVGGLEESVTEVVLRAAMIPFGPIKTIDMVCIKISVPSLFME